MLAKRVPSVLLVLLVMLAACAPQRPVFALRGIVEPHDDCVIDEGAPVVDHGLLDLAAAPDGHFAFLEVEAEPGAELNFLAALVRFALPDELEGVVPASTRSVPISSSTDIHPTGIATARLVGPDEVALFAAAPGSEVLRGDPDARLSLKLGVRVEVGELPAAAAASVSGVDRTGVWDDWLISNQVAFTLDLCMGCMTTICEPGLDPCYAAVSQPACLPEES